MEKYYFTLRNLLRKGTRIEIQKKSTSQWVNKFIEGEPVTCKDELDEQGQFELEWYLNCLDFNKKHFGAAASDIEKVRLLLAPGFFDALVALSIEAKRRGIKFSPMETMLEALLEKSQEVEREINRADGQKIEILEALGVEKNNESIEK